MDPNADLSKKSAVSSEKKDVSSELERLGELRRELAQIGYAYEEQTAASKEEDPVHPVRVGMHYTPLETASKIVKETLRPHLFREDGSPKNSEEILQLRIFDPAFFFWRPASS